MRKDETNSMRLDTDNQLYEGFEQVVDTTHECPIDAEYNLPDYCTDIQKILKCIVTPEVTSAVPAGDSISVDGTADIRVLYLDVKGESVRGFDIKKEFSFVLHTNTEVDGAVVKVHPSVQRMTCRALNARRVDIHAALLFSVQASAVRRMEITNQILSDAVEMQCIQYNASKAAGCTVHSFILDENMDLQNGKPTIDVLLRRTVKYRIEDIQMNLGEVQFSGKACVEVLYKSFADSAMPERMLFELPFTQNVECTGADELCDAEISFVGGVCNIQPREDSVGEYTILNIYLKPVFNIRLMKPDMISTVSDAFAVRGALAAKYKTFSLENLLLKPMRTLRVREVVRVPENDLERILDIWCDNLSISSFAEKDSSVIRGKFNLCILYQNKEKRISYTERVMDFTDINSVPEGKLIVEGEIGAIRFAITDSSSLECSIDLILREQIRTVCTVRSLDMAELDESVQGDSCYAAVYYAAAGDSVWDIAKRYQARVETIRKHNGCMAERIETPCPVIICRK